MGTKSNKTNLSIEDLFYSQGGFFRDKEQELQGRCLIVQGGSIGQASFIYNYFVNEILKKYGPNGEISFNVIHEIEQMNQDLVSKINEGKEFLFLYFPDGLNGLEKLERTYTINLGEISLKNFKLQS